MSEAVAIEDTEVDRLRRQLDEITDAYVVANEQLLALYRLSEFSSVSLDPTETLERTVREAKAVLGAATSNFLAADEGSDADSNDRNQARIIDDERSGQSKLTIPVTASDHFFGQLEVFSVVGERFSTPHLKLAEAICNQLAAILRLSHLHHEAVERTIMERDYETASALAQAALNRPLPEVDGLDLAAYNRPSRAAGGDFYAAARCGNGLYFALGDVSGKGLPAALIMSSAISSTHNAFERCPDGDASAVLTEIDNQMSSYLSEIGMFITMAVAYVDLDRNRVHISNAGHSPVILVQSDQATNLYADGPPIGVLDACSHEGRSWDFEHGDLLFIGSDGCTEQMNADEEMFSEDRVNSLVTALRYAPADLMLSRIVAEVDDFAGDEDQMDDLTAAVVRYNSGDVA